MKVIHLQLTGQTHYDPCVLAIGFFDGLHKGHMALIEEVKRVARETSLAACVMTFNKHPLEVLTKQPRTYLSTLEDRMDILTQEGIDVLYVIDFDCNVAALTPNAFISQYLTRIGVVHLVCGFDFRFGKDNAGDIALLREQAFALSVIPPVLYDEKRKVSSSLIKELLLSGDIEQANACLTRRYRITGRVIHGKHRGHALGFPTANVDYGQYCPLKRGVYGVYVQVGSQLYAGMANIGVNPTFHDRDTMSLEIHLFDFNGDIYGEMLSVMFVSFHRPEMAFDSAEALKSQLSYDAKTLHAALKP